MKKWEAIFTEADRALLKTFGRAERQPFGKRPALIIVDVVRSFIGSKPRSTLESAEEYRTSCGEAGWEALKHIKELLEAFRARNLPVTYTTVDPVAAAFAWGPDKKSSPEELSQEKWATEAWEIADEIKPLPSEPIIRKTKASAFLFTPLAPILQTRNRCQIAKEKNHEPQADGQPQNRGVKESSVAENLGIRDPKVKKN